MGCPNAKKGSRYAGRGADTGNLENAEGCRCRRHHFFFAAYDRLWTASGFRACGSAGTGYVAQHQHQYRCAGTQHRALRRNSLLWFIGVLRDRLGRCEDRLLSTVFVGSGLLFLAMLFVAAAVIGAIILAFGNGHGELIDSTSFHFARAVAYGIVNVYMIKFAGVFIITTSTVAIYTEFTPRWIALLGYGLAIIVLLGSFYLDWSFIVFPLWVLLISTYILLDDLHRARQTQRNPSDCG
jgi:hypothetical protein